MNSESPLDLMFATESILIDIKEHFKKYKEVLNNFDKTLRGLVDELDSEFVNSFNNSFPSIISVDNDPQPINEEIGAPREIYKSNLTSSVHKDSMQISLNTVKSRRNATKEHLTHFHGKWRNYNFLPSNQLTHVQPKSPDSANITDFEFHSSSTLEDLKDAIRCNMDYCGSNDCSETVKLTDVPKCTPKSYLLYPSSFFLIEDVFYTDTRKSCVDLTEEARDWLLETRMQAFSVKSLDVQFEELIVKIGRPYLYKHQASCEHIFIFSDIRFRSYNDEALPIKPHLRAISKNVFKYCLICSSRQVHWFVKDCLKLTLSKAYLCHDCFISYCYINGRKVSNFKAYPFVDQSVVFF